jgi:NUDIX domain
LSRWRTFGERTTYDNPWVWIGQIDVEEEPEQTAVRELEEETGYRAGRSGIW